MLETRSERRCLENERTLT